jgi:hypothetical protein
VISTMLGRFWIKSIYVGGGRNVAARGIILPFWAADGLPNIDG